MKRDTIAAIATPPGVGAISIVRISGPDSGKIAEELTGISNPKPRVVMRAELKDENGPIDDSLVVFYRAPRSYTGEDMVEIFCHGGPVVTRMALNAVLEKGARMAEPGEFTKRAFLNGKMDLTEAEAVRDLIEARSEEVVRVVVGNISGGLRELVESIRSEIIEILAAIEVEIDYPDEEDLEVADLPSRIESVIEKLGELIERSERVVEMIRGIRVVIVGKPNVGKSTLLNRLLKEDRAIVTPIPGTTRDTVEGELNIRGRHFRVVDTAGLRETGDPVEKIGVERTEREVERSDLILFLVDDSFNDEDLKIYEVVKSKRHVVVVNKIDMGFDIDTSWAMGRVVRISALEGVGIGDLEDAMIDLTEDFHVAGGSVLTSIRQIDLAKSALNSLKSALTGSIDGYPNDVISLDLQRALSFLDEITGRNFREDLLDTIFSTFCVGK